MADRVHRSTSISIARSARRSGRPTSPGRKLVLPPGADFAEELRALRAELGWDTVFLAELSGLDHSTISKLEKGTRYPTALTLGLLAQALDLHGAEAGRLYAAAGHVPPGWSICKDRSPTGELGR